MVLQVSLSWTASDGTAQTLLVADNAEAFAPGNPIFAWSGDDTLSASSGADTFVFSQYFYDQFGAGRPFHQLAHDLVFKTPGLRVLAERYGTVPASPENMATALEREAALLVYPGGDHETFRPTWESDQIDFAQRTGFVKLALEHRVPIVPVVSIGGQETALQAIKQNPAHDADR